MSWFLLLCFTLAVFIIASRNSFFSSDVKDYFLASRSLQTWLVVFSVLATEVSAASVVGGPDTAFNTNLAFLQTTIGSVLSRFVLACFFIQLYYRAGVVTVYSFLQGRFGARVQGVVAGVYCVGRLLASGARLYIAAFALSLVLECHFGLAIIGVGGIAMAYSLLGGLRTVAVTDVLQGTAFVLFGVGILYVVCGEAGGVWGVLNHARAAGKTELIVLGPSVFTAAFWRDPYTLAAGVLGGFTLGLATHGTDQDIVQRFLASRKSSSAKRSMLLVGLLEIPMTLLFVAIGTALWSYFQQAGILVPPGASVLPFYVREHLGVFGQGIFVIAVFAAALSSLDSVINALGSVTVSDFNLGCFNSDNARLSIRLAQVASLLWGLALILVALLLGWYHQSFLAVQSDTVSRNAELLTLALGVMSTIYGPLLGIFLTAVCTRRGGQYSALLGLILGLMLNLYLQFFAAEAIAWTWRVVFGALLSFLICVAAPGRQKYGLSEV